MIIIFSVLCIIMILSLRVCRSGLDGDYLSKENTQAIKGIFVIIVFLSHVRTYADYSHSTDLFVINVLNYLGQLMVAVFLFYSGYGIYESYKKKGYEYIKAMPRNRIGKTFFDFAIAILLFLFMDLILGIKYSVAEIALAFVGWTTVGNSNWYMFAIFTLYILTFISFTIFRRNGWIPVICITVCSLGYVYIMSLVKENWWSSTYLCYVAGIYYSYFKEKLDRLLKKSMIIYYVITAGIVGSYLYMFQYRYVRLMLFNCVAVLFCLVIVFLSMKISFKSRVLYFCGQYLFWIYILQRIPMKVFAEMQLNLYNPYIYLIACFSATIFLAVVIEKVAGKIKKRIWT